MGLIFVQKEDNTCFCTQMCVLSVLIRPHYVVGLGKTGNCFVPLNHALILGVCNLKLCHNRTET